MVEIIETHITPYDTDRRLHIYVPDNPKENERFPVIYMFDGHNLFDDSWATYGKSWGLKDYFDKHNVRAMIVGIECNHEGDERMIEFSPYDYNGTYTFGASKGKELFEWMVSELKDFIDSNYPTLPQRQHTYIGGSSMGGLMALYGICAHNDVYCGAAALSPHHPFCMNELLKDCKRKLDPDTRIYISWGSDESPNKKLLARWSNNNIRVVRALAGKAIVYPHLILNGTHCEACWEKETGNWVKELQIKKKHKGAD